MDPTISLKCEVCYQPYNLSNKLPRNIPQCGHSLCSQCISEMLRFPDQLRCPLDNQVLFHQMLSLNAFPVNIQLQNIIQDHSLDWGICQIHQKDFEYACVTHSVKLCNDCAIFGDHSNGQMHNIQLLRDCNPLLNEQLEMLQKGLYSLDSYYQEANRMLLEKKVNSLRLAAGHFDQLKRMLREKERHLSQELETFFDNQIKTLNIAYGQFSDFRRNIIDKISQCESYIRTSHPFSTLEEEMEEIALKTDYSFLKEKIEKTNSSLDELFNSLDMSFICQIDAFNRVGNPDKVFKDLDFKNFCLAEEPKGFSNGYYKVKSTIKNPTMGGCLEIELDPQTATTLSQLTYIT